MIHIANTHFLLAFISLFLDLPDLSMKNNGFFWFPWLPNSLLHKPLLSKSQDNRGEVGSIHLWVGDIDKTVSYLLLLHDLKITWDLQQIFFEADHYTIAQLYLFFEFACLFVCLA